MIPTREQFRNKWSLPSKWSYWAAVIGIPVGIVSLGIGLYPFIQSDTEGIERNRLIFQVAQELRYNHEWLSEVVAAISERSQVLPVGSLKSDALMTLANHEYQRVTEHAYGEEKYIYQEALKLKDLGAALSKLKNYSDVEILNRQATYSLHDMLFLNDFLHWYLRPLIEKELDQQQVYSLGWRPFPADRFKIDGVTTVRMKRFVHEGKPIDSFSEYLGLID
jgi:hypothetical protein